MSVVEQLTKGRHRSRDGGTDRFDRVLVAHRLVRTGIGGCLPAGAHVARDARSPDRELATIGTVSSLAEVFIPAPSCEALIDEDLRRVHPVRSKGLERSSHD